MEGDTVNNRANGRWGIILILLFLAPSVYADMIAGDEGVDLGNNSVQVVDLTPLFSVDRLEVVFSSSGAIAELEFADAVVPVDQSTWGGVKTLFR